MTELVAQCKRKLTPNLEGGLISCLVLLIHVIPYLSDSSLMDVVHVSNVNFIMKCLKTFDSHIYIRRKKRRKKYSMDSYLQEMIVKSILLPTVRILSTSRFAFPNGAMARFVLANKYLETVFLLVIRLGNVMAKNHLTLPIQRFFIAFEKVFNSEKFEKNDDEQTSISKENNRLR